MLPRTILIASLLAVGTAASAQSSLVDVESSRPAVARPQAPPIVVNNTSDRVLGGECALVTSPCPLRAAVERAESQPGADRVIFRIPTSDPGYDAGTGYWTITLGPRPVPFILLNSGETVVDGTTQVQDWQGPQDSRVIVTSSGDVDNAFDITGPFNTITGLIFSGEFLFSAIRLEDDALENTIGPGNIFSGISGSGIGIHMGGPDVTGNRVVGNWFGVDLDGQGDAANADSGIIIEDAAHDNTIGGQEGEDRNVFGANDSYGIFIRFRRADHNVVAGNYFGTDPSGTRALGNGSAILVSDGPNRTQISGNLIAGSENTGIDVIGASAGTEIRDNIVGWDANVRNPLPNGGTGIQLFQGPDDSLVEANVVGNNRGCGILVSGPGAERNRLSANRVTANRRGICLGSGVNGGLRAPSVESATRGQVTGTACPGCRVEVFSDPNDQAAVYEGFVTADDQGRFTFQAESGPVTGPNVTTTATDSNGNTSSLSEPVAVSTGAEPTATGSPEPTPTQDTPGQFRVFMPHASHS
jgi:hypothetical protein